MIAQIWSIASFTVMEAMRNRLPRLVIVILLLGLGVSQFLGALAITESAGIQSGFLGAMLRLAAVMVVSLFVITSVVRELNDKVLDLLLSLPIPRAAYFFGKLCGFAIFAILIAVLFSALLLLYASPFQVALWGASLGAELLIITALSLLCLFTFNQVTVALSVVIAFYSLSRSIGAIQLMAHGPLVNPNSLTQQLASGIIDAIAYLLPDLYRFTSSEWLIYSTGDMADLAPLMLQTVAYLILLSGAALFDLYRKNL